MDAIEDYDITVMVKTLKTLPAEPRHEFFVFGYEGYEKGLQVVIYMLL
jgi:hypothetical protein